jgi:Transcriptional regulator/sugar kinase
MGNIFRDEKDNKFNPAKSKIIELFINNGNSTNNDLAKELGLSVPTVSKMVGELNEEGFVNEYGKLETAEGRKPTLYGLNPDSGYFVGVDCCKSSVDIGIINFRGDLIALCENEPMKIENTLESLDKLCELILDFIAKSGVDRKKIFNVNFNISGRVNPDSGYSYSIFNFSEEPLTRLLSEKLQLNASIENDTRAMAYGEYLKGQGNGEQHVLFVNLSWGLGMGIIIDGKLYKGKSGYAGGLGHMHAFDNEVLCQCGKKGCLETEASGSAFLRIVKDRLSNGETSVLSDIPQDELTLDNLVDALLHEDPLCIDIVEQMGYALGGTLAGIINIFNPELVIIGGTLSVAGDYLIHPIKSAIIKNSLNLVNRDSRIVLSKLREKAGVIGACMMARKLALD